MRLYLDTSAAMKLVTEERESRALAAALDSLGPEDVVLSSWLLHVELHCAAARLAGVPDAAVGPVLEQLLMVDLTRADLLAAPERGSGLRPQDAIHLAVAVRTGCDVLLTYDAEQAAAAGGLGIEVLQPA